VSKVGPRYMSGVRWPRAHACRGPKKVFYMGDVYINTCFLRGSV